jgi:hypothetical protein
MHPSKNKFIPNKNAQFVAACDVFQLKAPVELKAIGAVNAIQDFESKNAPLLRVGEAGVPRAGSS